MKRFDTPNKKLAHIIPGNIITFKTGKPIQLAIKKVDIKNGEGRVVIDSLFFQERTFDSVSSLFEAIDWDWMEENCIFKDYSNL